MDPVSNLEPIPRPPGHLLVGNLFDLDAAHPMEGLAELARKYGPYTGSTFPVSARASLPRASNSSTRSATNQASTKTSARA